MDITHAGGVGSPSYAALQRPYLRPPSDVVERAAAAHAEAWPSSAAYLACPARAHALRFAHIDNPPASSAPAAASPPVSPRISGAVPLFTHAGYWAWIGGRGRSRVLWCQVKQHEVPTVVTLELKIIRREAGEGRRDEDISFLCCLLSLWAAINFRKM